MDIIISNTGGQPIYEQICRQVKGAIATGKLKPGEALPSIRALARDLRISVITTKRAYEELERDGFICTVAGKGSFVAQQDLELAKESNLREIEYICSQPWSWDGRADWQWRTCRIFCGYYTRRNKQYG